jgi:hypothetical protein
MAGSLPDVDPVSRSLGFCSGLSRIYAREPMISVPGDWLEVETSCTGPRPITGAETAAGSRSNPRESAAYRLATDHAAVVSVELGAQNIHSVRVTHVPR